MEWAANFVIIHSYKQCRHGFNNGRQLQWVTMKLEHTKSAESLIRGCSVAQQVHLLSQLRILELMGTRSLPTPGLCQPRSLPEP